MKSYELANWYLDLNKVSSSVKLEEHIAKIPINCEDTYIFNKIIDNKFFISSLWLYIPARYITLELLLNIVPLDENTFKLKFDLFELPKKLLDETTLLKLVMHEPNFIKNIPNQYKTFTICKEAIHKVGRLLQNTPNHIQTKELIQLACSNIENLKFAAPNILTNEDIIEIICINTFEKILNPKVRLDMVPVYYHSPPIVKLLIEYDVMNIVRTEAANKSPKEYVDWMAIDCFFDVIEQQNITVKNSITNTIEPLHLHILNILKDLYPELSSAIKIGVRGTILANLAKDFLINNKISIKSHALPLF